MIPFLPAIITAAAVTTVAGVVYVARRQPTLSRAQLIAIGMPTSTKGGTVTIQQAKRFPLKVMPIVPPLPKRAEKQTEAEKIAEFKAQWQPAYLSKGKCKSWYWGFNMLQVGQDAAAYGGAQMVSQIIDWIMTYTGLSQWTDLLNLKFRFELEKFDVYKLDADGWVQPVAKKRKRIAPWTPRQNVPFVPGPEVDGVTQVWISKNWGGVYSGEDDNIITVIRPIPGIVYAGMPTWEWTWLIATTELRALLRHDQINLSTLSAVQCDDSRWWPVTRKYVDEIYK